MPFWNKCSVARLVSMMSYWSTWIWREAWSAACSTVCFQAFLVWFLVWKCRRVLPLIIQIDWIKFENLPCRNKTLAKVWLHQLRGDRTFYNKTLTALIILPWTPEICLECLLCCNQSQMRSSHHRNHKQRTVSYRPRKKLFSFCLRIQAVLLGI